MRRRTLLVVIMVFLTLSLAGVSHGWQGRMAGMGDPFGLVADESDFLIHPSGIADGKGINFYGNYRFSWQDVTNWNYTMKQFNMAAGTLNNHLSFKTSGEEQKHDALVGAALPLGPGRLGLFFQYTGKEEDFDGHGRDVFFGVSKYNFDNNLDAFALRVLYGLPIGAFKVGSEVQLAYQTAENTDTFITSGGDQVLLNDIIGSHIPPFNTFPFQFPYDSRWWEMLFKASVEGSLGPGKLSVTARGGFIFSGDNVLRYRNVIPAVPFVLESINFNGNVEGWNVGGDLWWRTPLKKGLSLPLLVRVDYNRKTWDGKGINVPLGNLPFKYESSERNFYVEAGGGFDMDFGNGTRIAFGPYYNYLEGNRSFFYELIDQKTDHTDYPLQKEHRVLFKVAGEKEFCPSFAGRFGVNFFYGWVNEDYRFKETFFPPSGFGEKISVDGYHWGATASLGGTLKLSRVSLEPFINAGYQKLSVDGNDGVRGTTLGLSMDKVKEEWLVGAGLSIRY